ncbi:hypothetical protein ERJ75_001725400 [Trypanosoma vivax]|nr:hypothetical protein ERJ75_001725400 [Trypanosoma vivax]
MRNVPRPTPTSECGSPRQGERADACCPASHPCSRGLVPTRHALSCELRAVPPLRPGVPAPVAATAEAGEDGRAAASVRRRVGGQLARRCSAPCRRSLPPIVAV